MSVFDRLSTIRDCLCEQIVASGCPNVTFCEVVPGEVAASDYFNCGGGGGGMAWVRLITSYRATQVGIADVTVGNCGRSTGFDVELGIMRCYDGQSVNGRPPSAKTVREAAATQLMDMETMQQAILCCDALHSKDYVVGSYQPLGPEGGVVGGILTVSVI